MSCISYLLFCHWESNPLSTLLPISRLLFTTPPSPPILPQLFLFPFAEAPAFTPGSLLVPAPMVSSWSPLSAVKVWSLSSLTELVVVPLAHIRAVSGSVRRMLSFASLGHLSGASSFPIWPLLGHPCAFSTPSLSASCAQSVYPLSVFHLRHGLSSLLLLENSPSGSCPFL